jgi:hypothetical protein
MGKLKNCLSSLKFCIMKHAPIIFSFFLVSLSLLLESCSSGKKAYYSGNYYEAVITSTNRLRKDPNHKKSIETLRQAYPLAVQFYDDRAKAALASNAEFKWNAVVDAYTTINVMGDEIRRSPGALQVVPNPANYYAKLDEAKRNAAEEKYAAGIVALQFGTRDKAKLAYTYFKDAHAYIPGYKDVINMMDAALMAATIKVVMEPIPVMARNVQVSAVFFDDKVSEFLHTSSINDFVRFYTRPEVQRTGVTPDHIIQIEFDDYTIGQVYLQEKESVLERDSIVTGTYIAPSGLTSGNRTTQPAAPAPMENSQPVTGNPAPIIPDKPAENPQPVNQSPKEPLPVSDVPPQPSDEAKEPGQPADNKDKSAGQPDKPYDPLEDDFPSDEIKDKDRVTICHIPPGNESARHTLVIAKSALAAHLAHGDFVGACEEGKDKGKPASPGQKGQPDKANDKKPSGNSPKGNDGHAWLTELSSQPMVLLASTNPNMLSTVMMDEHSLFSDTVKIYGRAKATYYHYRKTVTSRGTVNFRIIDARTNAVLRVEKLPGEYVWVSEWATFNGDERALTPEQLSIARQREQVPPQAQDMFILFTQPIYNQLINQISSFYRNY